MTDSDNTVLVGQWLDWEALTKRGERFAAAHIMRGILAAADDPAFITAQVAQFVARRLVELDSAPAGDWPVVREKYRAPGDDAYELVSLYLDGHPHSLRAADRLARVTWHARPEWWPPMVITCMLELLPYQPAP